MLVSDWDLIKHKKSLFALPAKITVANILSEYVKNAEKLATGMLMWDVVKSGWYFSLGRTDPRSAVTCFFR